MENILYRPLSGPTSIFPNMIHRIPETCTAVRSIAFVFLAIALCYLSLPSYAQKPHAPKVKLVAAEQKPDEKSTVEPGVVVEEVEAGREGDKAGLKVGDVILGWSRGDATGNIESPFDYIWIDIEQRPRGEVTLDGMRADQKMTWMLGRGEWGLTADPIFVGRLKGIYAKANQLANGGRQSDAARYWLKNCGVLPHEKWLPAWSQFYAALLFRQSDDVVRADDAYRLAVKLAADAGIVAKSRILNSWGGMYCHRGDYKLAEGHFRESANSLPPTYDTTLMKAFYLNDLGAVQTVENRFDEAIDSHQKAIRIRQEISPGGLEFAKSLSDLGELELERGNQGLAYEYFHRALPIQEKYAPLSHDHALTLYGLGRIALLQGDFVAAESYYKLTESIWKTDDSDMGNVLVGFGSIAFGRDDLKASLDYFGQALAIERRMNSATSINAGTTLCNLSEVLLRLGRTSEAASYSVRCLKILRTMPHDLVYAAGLATYGKALMALDRKQESETILKQALLVETKYNSPSPFQADALMTLGELSRHRRDLNGAKAYFLDAYNLLRNLSSGSVDEAASLIALAEIARDTHDLESEENYYRKALTALDSQMVKLGVSPITLANYRANHELFYRDYLNILVFHHKTEEAFQLLERSRARMLLETLSAAAVDIHHGADPELLKRERALQTEIKAKSDHRVHMLTQQHTLDQMKALESEIADLTRQYDEVEENLRSTSPNYSALTQPKPLTTEEIQKQLLDTDTVLVEYSLGEKRSYAFVVTPDSLTAHELPSRLKIEQAARRLHRLLKNYGSGSAQGSATSAAKAASKDVASKAAQAQLAQRETQRTAALLSRMVLDPIAGEIGNKRLLIVRSEERR